MKLLTSIFLIVTIFNVDRSLSYTVPTGGSMISSFGGSVLLTQRLSTPQTSISSASSKIEMKKGKANVPPMMRSQYKRQQEIQSMREQMLAAQRPGPDGLPVFNLFVRTKRANMWYPCGSFKGDDRSAALCASWRDNGLLAGVSKKQLDAGVSGSLFRDQEKLKETIVRAYPQLRESKDELQFGFKLAYEGLSEEQTKIFSIEPKEQKGVLDNIKNMFSGN